jgi:ribosomal protein S18 acetylase RimI-like enzyme
MADDSSEWRPTAGMGYAVTSGIAQESGFGDNADSVPYNPIDLTIRQFSEAWRTMCADAPGYARLNEDGLECVFSGVPVAFFNVGLVTGRQVTAADLERHGRRAGAFAAERGDVPWLFVTTEEALAPGTDAAAVLDACGLARIMTLTGMVARRVAPVSRVPDGLQLTVPCDEGSCAALLDVNSAAYSMDLNPAKSILGRPEFWAPHFPVLGRAAGAPACTSAVLMVDGYRYVALVATDPAHQRRGFADAAMRQSLEHAARIHGETPTFLHATDAGKPVYERMCYRAVSSHGMFLGKQFLAGH